MTNPTDIPRTPPRKSATFDDYTLAEIRRAAATGIYDIRGAGAKRKVPPITGSALAAACTARSVPSATAVRNNSDFMDIAPIDECGRAAQGQRER